jgi:hypothetical protein
MANTTNFGWETPDDTDLVKDGAAAIRTLAGAIDTSLVDLKGGTTDQVLAKNSGSDMDFKWVADASGIPATIFDAKGDLIVASAADTAARLASSASNGDLLTVDTSTATGLKWAAPASGGGMTLLTSGALSGSSTVFSFTSTGYINIQIHFKNVWLNSGANGIKMRINADTGNNYAQGRYQLSPTAGDANTVTDHFLLTFRANGGSQAFYKNGHGIVTLYRPTDTDVIYMIGDCSGTDSASGGDTWYNHIIGIYDCSAAVSSITLFPNANDFANGNAYVYGVK